VWINACVLDIDGKIMRGEKEVLGEERVIVPLRQPEIAEGKT
jgi:hypothetical protein